MRLDQAELGFLNLLLLSNIVSAITLDCGHVRASGQSFNFKSLDGPHSVQHKVSTPPTLKNTTYTIDLCRGLPKVGEIDKTKQCPHNTRGTATPGLSNIVSRILLPQVDIDNWPDSMRRRI